MNLFLKFTLSFKALIFSPKPQSKYDSLHIFPQELILSRHTIHILQEIT